MAAIVRMCEKYRRVFTSDKRTLSDVCGTTSETPRFCRTRQNALDQGTMGHGSLGSLTKEVEDSMKKRAPRSTTKKSAAKKTVGANHRTPPARRKLSGWQRAFERNLRAEGFSAEEARELVEIAAS